MVGDHLMKAHLFLGRFTVNEFLWVEKYRPNTIQDCVLPSKIKSTFIDIVNGGELHNMLLTGTPGLGKTTVAKALCNELELDYLLINGSEESGCLLYTSDAADE